MCLCLRAGDWDHLSVWGFSSNLLFLWPAVRVTAVILTVGPVGGFGWHNLIHSPNTLIVYLQSYEVSTIIADKLLRHFSMGVWNLDYFLYVKTEQNIGFYCAFSC